MNCLLLCRHQLNGEVQKDDAIVIRVFGAPGYINRMLERESEVAVLTVMSRFGVAKPIICR